MVDGGMVFYLRYIYNVLPACRVGRGGDRLPFGYAAKTEQAAISLELTKRYALVCLVLLFDQSQLVASHTSR